MSFFLILCNVDLTKKRVGGILKKEEVPEHLVISTSFFCPKRTQDRYSGSDWAVIFFSSTYKGRKERQ